MAIQDYFFNVGSKGVTTLLAPPRMSAIGVEFPGSRQSATGPVAAAGQHLNRWQLLVSELEGLNVG
jgi:hypothetical protein